MGTPPRAPKLKALAKNPKVSLTIDDNDFPHKVLLIRGSARLETVDGIVPEYVACRRTLLRARRERGLDGPASHPCLNHGADFDHAGMGWVCSIFRPAFPAPYRNKTRRPGRLVRAGKPAQLALSG